MKWTILSSFVMDWVLTCYVAIINLNSLEYSYYQPCIIISLFSDLVSTWVKMSEEFASQIRSINTEEEDGDSSEEEEED